MKLRHLWAAAAALLLAAAPARADEGMWMLGNLDKDTRRAMKDLGLELTARQLYDPHGGPSLKDAVVSFGGFCSGVVVSDSGLVLTNHHCGFGSIRQHSTVDHDYLTDGFAAPTLADELPCPELFVRFLVRQQNVTRRVLSAVRPGMTEGQRTQAIDSVMWAIEREVAAQDSTTVGAVDPFYAGNEFWLSVYRDYADVRLVYAPPSSVGKFGREDDNWEWPRHTGDFSVFRIYAGPDNQPAPYSPDNRPYRPACVAPVTLDGYAEGSFCMTLGYPGSTERYLSSYGIRELMQGPNQAQIDVRGVKQRLWREAMQANDTLRLKYAQKYDESSNYWKNSIGMNRALRRLHVLEKKEALEREVQAWIDRTPRERRRLGGLMDTLALAYRARRDVHRAQAYLEEAFFNGPELVQLALGILNFNFDDAPDVVAAGLEDIVDQYAGLDPELDCRVFAAMLDVYRSKVDPARLPPFYHVVDSAFGGDARAYARDLYARTQLVTPRGLQRFLERDTTYNIAQDPAVEVCIDLLSQLFGMSFETYGPTREIRRGERLLNAAVRRLYSDRRWYPDANSTLRLSFGTVGGYAPRDGVAYRYYTTARGVLEKVRAHPGNPDYAVQPALLRLLASRRFGRYASADGEMRVCFLSNNDITGGNSGSAMFDARGRLLGLAFDGNWEAMSSDILYEPRLQRTIGVDIRYVLFIMEHWGTGGQRLVEEMKIR